MSCVFSFGSASYLVSLGIWRGHLIALSLSPSYTCVICKVWFALVLIDQEDEESIYAYEALKSAKASLASIQQQYQAIQTQQANVLAEQQSHRRLILGIQVEIKVRLSKMHWPYIKNVLEINKNISLLSRNGVLDEETH